jgi:hypothetical protein
VLLDKLPGLLSRDAVLPGEVFDLVSLPARYALTILIAATRCFLVCHVVLRAVGEVEPGSR